MSRTVVGSARSAIWGGVNASKSTLLRALSGLGYAALLLTLFGACSGNDGSPPLPPDGPASLAITGIALGHGFVSEDEASWSLACDYSVGVNVQMAYWTLRGPGQCGGALQCGQLRVTLLGGADGSTELLNVIAAGNGVALDLQPLLSATPPLQDGDYVVKVELVDDAGKAYIGVDGGNGSDQKAFKLRLPADCPSTAGSGGATSGAGGAGNGAGGNAAGGGGVGGNAIGGDSAGSAGAAGAADTMDNAGASGG